jgi:hypothetical protein
LLPDFAFLGVAFSELACFLYATPTKFSPHLFLVSCFSLLPSLSAISSAGLASFASLLHKVLLHFSFVFLLHEYPGFWGFLFPPIAEPHGFGFTLQECRASFEFAIS